MAKKSKKKVPALTFDKLKKLAKFIQKDLCRAPRMSKKLIQSTIDANGGPERMKYLLDSMELK